MFCSNLARHFLLQNCYNTCQELLFSYFNYCPPWYFLWNWIVFNVPSNPRLHSGFCDWMILILWLDLMMPFSGRISWPELHFHGQFAHNSSQLTNLNFLRYIHCEMSHVHQQRQPQTTSSSPPKKCEVSQIILLPKAQPEIKNSVLPPV